jgi:sulfur carrier protein ThiS
MPEDKAFVKSFQVGNVHVDVGGTEGKPIGQVADELGIRREGTTWILNGERLPQATAEETRIKSGDELRAQPKTDNG